MANNFSKIEISPTKRSKSVTRMTDDSVLDNVEPLSSEPYGSYA